MSGPLELFSYQKVGAKFLADAKRALLADDMGIGKSAQAISTCTLVEASDILVVCPASLVENWRREFKKFSALTPTVVSYNKVSAAHLKPWDAIILDEAHYLKTPKLQEKNLRGGSNWKHRTLT